FAVTRQHLPLIYALSLHDALPIFELAAADREVRRTHPEQHIAIGIPREPTPRKVRCRECHLAPLYMQQSAEHSGVVLPVLELQPAVVVRQVQGARVHAGPPGYRWQSSAYTAYA